MLRGAGLRVRGDRPELAAQLEALLGEAFDRFSVERVDLHDGKLVAEVRFLFVAPVFYGEILEVLRRAAALFDRAPLRVRILGGERRALCAGGKARCAYCHADVSGDEPDLVACELCATVLHASCWDELERCPVLGCAGTRREESGLLLATPSPRETP
jgi:hypothetical protein